MENFENVFTVEAYFCKGWEVISTHTNLEDAINRFRQELLMTPLAAMRITSPTNLDIYV